MSTTVQYTVVSIPLVLFVLITASSIGRVTEGMFTRIGTDALASDGSAAEPGKSPVATGSGSPGILLGTIFSVAAVGLFVFCAMLVIVILLASRAGRKRDEEPGETEPCAAIMAVRGSDVAFAKRQQILRVLREDAHTILQGRLEVQHVMTRHPHTILSGQSVQEALEEMDAKGVDHLLVTDRDHKLVGLVSKYYAERSGAARVADAMLTDPITVEPTALLSPTVTQMIAAGVSCIAVADQRRPVGVLTTVDIHLALQCTLVMLLRASNAAAAAEEVPAPETQEPLLVG